MKPLLLAVALLAALLGFSQLPTPDDAHTEVVVTTGHPESPAPSLWEMRPLPHYVWGPKPPPVVVRTPEADHELRAWTTCWSGPPRGLLRRSAAYCADGAPGLAGPLPLVRGGDVADFWFGLPGWRFSATFKQLDTGCPFNWTHQARTTGRQTFQLDPAGPAGRYEVSLFGKGKQGDVAMSFVWETTKAGPVPQPTGYTAVLADHDGKLDSYGVELGLSNLRGDHTAARASVTVSAANGASVRLPLALGDDRADGQCYDRGALSFSASESVGRRAATLGEGPFTYTVRLRLDSRTYVGTATWPDDEDPEIAPGVPLSWEPALPAYVVK